MDIQMAATAAFSRFMPLVADVAAAAAAAPTAGVVLLPPQEPVSSPYPARIRLKPTPLKAWSSEETTHELGSLIRRAYGV